MHAAREELPIILEAGDANVRAADWNGMRVVVVSAPAGTDFGPLLEGLPKDLCPCPHWGYVMKGRLRIEHADGTTEVLSAGDVYHLPPGHTGVAEEQTQFLEVSPPDEHQRFIDAAKANLAEA
jgi:hypothetical protein